MNRTRFFSIVRLAAAGTLVTTGVATGVLSAILTLPLISTSNAAPAADPLVMSFEQMHALSTTIGSAQVLPTTRTVPHWFGSTLDPHNGVTYGYHMAGADPNNCSGGTAM